VGRSEGRKQLGKLRHRWEDNIEVNLQEVVVVNAVMNVQVL
jgi:hypothetical protein